MVRRSIVRIDEKMCNGCGKCVVPCAEGAITVVNGKAKVLREDICDGLGYCVGICPTGALSLEEKETITFDKEAADRQRSTGQMILASCFRCGCSEEKVALFPIRIKGMSEWVCAKCIPQLIHG